MKDEKKFEKFLKQQQQQGKNYTQMLLLLVWKNSSRE